MDSGWCYEVQRIVASEMGTWWWPRAARAFNPFQQDFAPCWASNCGQIHPGWSREASRKAGKEGADCGSFPSQWERGAFAEAYGFEWHVVRSFFFYTSRLLRFSGAW